MTDDDWREMIARRTKNTGETEGQAIAHLKREIARYLRISEDEVGPGMNEPRNDSGLALDQVAEVLEDAVVLSYKGITLRVQQEKIDEAKAEIAALPSGHRRPVRAQVIKCLDAFNAKMSTGNFSKQEADDAMADLCLLQALDALDPKKGLRP